MATFKVSSVETTPFDDQKPGTSGLRKKVKIFKQPKYFENFVQSTFNALGADKIEIISESWGILSVYTALRRSVPGFSQNLLSQLPPTLFSLSAIIIKMAAANGVSRIWVGQNGLLSTPAVSAVIRERVGPDGSKANGAFLLTASHIPGGQREDFGIKYNIENGGPAPEGITDKIFENTKTIKDTIGLTSLTGPEGQFDVDVFDSASDYVKLMNFEKSYPSICLAMFTNVVTTLGFLKMTLMNHACFSLLVFISEDFGGGHPDPNLTYAKELVACMGLGKTNTEQEPPEFGAAADGDADRNMPLHILIWFFVTPSDSVAIIAANSVQTIPYFSGCLKGVARSMPTSAALDVVATHLNLKVFEVPTGWKFFGNLMDAGMCSVCGEESFGIGSDHIREKDGIWAVLAWLSILAYKNKDNLREEKLVTVEDIVRQHWATYGRHYYTRYDYEVCMTCNLSYLLFLVIRTVLYFWKLHFKFKLCCFFKNVDAGGAKELMAHLVKLQSSLDVVNKHANDCW
ncbi:phosphoglucomutase, cytoplasmic [Olea europaea subsp. europaea]|uniref:phosphoglucomutase (alpha-D-glucose-1,6-bisphosphate-dependent) n=1 Tax=Olea europaea subsp. europaea TaxID=158383 RepID=A0A8S0RFI5_OLEEU|nr:phosphoglucomutase, cytoplasmic [Olea europaea subsp. europaea]